MTSSQKSDSGGTTKLFNNPVLSDVTIRQTFKGVSKEYHAHKQILSNQSDWFLKAFTGKFKESTDKVVEVHDDDPVHFEAMMIYFYFHDWSLAKREGPDSQRARQQFLEVLGVYTVADKYGCADLKHFAAGRIDSAGKKLDPTLPAFEAPDVFEELIKVHYSQCVEKYCEMGRALARYLRTTRFKSFLLSIPCAELVKNYPEFARDVFLESQSTGKLLG